MTRRVAIAGFGAIGREVARRLDAGIPGFALAAVASRDQDKARANLEGLTAKPKLVPLARLAEEADIVVECVPAASFADAVGPALDAGRIVITVSGAALLFHPEMVERARKAGGRLILATGALLGLDAVKAAAIGRIERVVHITRKPPKSLLGAPYLKANAIDVEALKEPLRVFAGTAREGAKAFPANVNVAAALSLAGIGPDRTLLEVWADPSLTRNTHRIEVEADSARFTMAIENVPSEDNPGTGKITALSMIAALKDLGAPFRVGT
jgi:aspartate dehydrogenase